MEAIIAKIDNIQRCSIFAKMVEFNVRLSISITLKVDTDDLRALAIASIKQQLPAHKTPVNFYFEPKG